jgi:hypothetical protein
VAGTLADSDAPLAVSMAAMAENPVPKSFEITQ